MKYNGKELVEMTREDWDGKFRRMLVWNDNDTSCHLSYVVGYSYIESRRNGFIEYDSMWCSNDAAEYGPTLCVETWQHCADVPDEEPAETNEESYITNNMTEEEIIEKFKTLRTELKQWLKNQDPNNLLMNNLQYGIKTALNLTHANHHFIDVVNFSNIDTNVKKTRVMTNKELSEWLARGTGVWAWCNHVTGIVGDSTIHKTIWEYRNENADEPCTKNLENSIRIKGWGETEWREPIVYA